MTDKDVLKKEIDEILAKIRSGNLSNEELLVCLEKIQEYIQEQQKLNKK